MTVVKLHPPVRFDGSGQTFTYKALGEKEGQYGYGNTENEALYSLYASIGQGHLYAHLMES